MLNKEHSRPAGGSFLLFNFEVDKSTNKVSVTKDFDAAVSLVWAAFTTQELLDQWWAPKPLLSKTKYMNFTVGGKRFYTMLSPEGEELGWQIFEYTSISPITHFTCLSYFADSDETPHPPPATWDLRFSEKNTGAAEQRLTDITTVSITIYNESFERLERLLDGFTQGMKMSLSNLENLLATLSKK